MWHALSEGALCLGCQKIMVLNLTPHCSCVQLPYNGYNYLPLSPCDSVLLFFCVYLHLYYKLTYDFEYNWDMISK